ncbi:dipeptidase [Thermogemmatispora carboxidivorans]|uniref:dipeptidase n=1 Tax=Thermogemmatispora carboxidivorans TaxID=1382306 RepID=UPI00069BDDA5|nr:membrane dipeptidase [Thermogemmatispora carboxidivorans]
MFIVDAHQDIAYNALEWGRDLRRSVAETRALEAREHPDYCREDAQGGLCMVGLPELRRGDVAIVFGTLFAYPLVGMGKPVNPRYRLSQAYRDPDGAWRVAREQLDYYRQLTSEAGVWLLLTQEDLERFMGAWSQSNAADPQRPFGLVPLMEGADAVRRPEEVEDWFAAGLRVLGLAWVHGSHYCGGNGRPGPLTSEGLRLLRHMERVGLVLDISHLAEESFWQALEHFGGTVIASHSNCRALVDSPRHLSDAMIRAIAERGGVIGIAPVNSFLYADWSRSQPFPVSLRRAVEHIDHVCQVTGSASYVGIGSDLDGGAGRDEAPVELETVADFPRLAEALAAAGYSQEDIVRIMGGNWLRLLERVLPRAADAQLQPTDKG